MNPVKLEEPIMQRRTRAWVVVLVALGAGALGFAGEGRKTFPASSGGKLLLELEAGATVAIEGSGGQEVEVAYTNDCSPPCEMQFEETKDGLKIRTAFSSQAGSNNADIELTIKVPARFDVEVDSQGGGLSIAGVEGEFTGRTMGGELTLRRVRGEAGLTTMGGEIELSDSELDGFLKTMGGDVSFENVVGDVRGSSMGGDVRYKNVQARGGSLASPNADDAKIAELDPESVQISTMGGEIEVENAVEGADLRTMGGDIAVADARRFVRATTMGGNIRIGSIDGWVQATTMGGNIEAHLTGDGGEVALTSMGGEIELSVPDGFGMDLDLEIAYTRNSAQNFKITAPGELKYTVTAEWDHSQGSPRKYIRMQGAVNGGGPKVKVRTINGNVKVQEAR